MSNVSGAVANSDDRAVPAADPPSILSKAFDLLNAFDADNRVMTLSEISRASGLPKSTVHRLIARLVDLGAIEQHRSGYVISVQMMRLAGSSPAGGMRDLALPYMAALHRWSGQTVQLGVLRQFDVVVMEEMGVRGGPLLGVPVGGVVTANASALGKALLSYEHLDDLAAFLPRPMPSMTPRTVTDVDELVDELRRARAAGVAHDEDETREGLSSVAVPIVIRGHAVGALGLGRPSEEPLQPKVEHALRDTAAQIARLSQEGLRGRTHYFPRDF